MRLYDDGCLVFGSVLLVNIFGSAPDSCLMAVVPASDDLIKFTVEPRVFHACPRFCL